MRLDVDGATPGTAVRIVLEREATLRWAPSRPPTEFEIYDVRFERAGAPTLSGDPVAPAFELARDMDMQRGVLDASRRSAWTGAALGVPYRAVLYDLLGEVPGCAVDVAPLTGGEDRRVVVPLPDRLGVVRLRVSKIDGRPAAGAKLRYRLAPTDGSAPVFEDGSFAPAFFVEKEAEAILRDVRIAPLTVWIVDAEKGWGTLRTTARPSGEDAAVELRLRPTRSLVFRFRTRFRVFGGVCLRAVSAEGTTVPCATSTGADPQDRRWAGGALLCPADALRLVWRVSGRNLSVDLPACEAFARDEREAPLPGVGELVVKSAGERPVPAFDVEPVRVAGLDGWTAEDGAWALAAGSGPFRLRHRSNGAWRFGPAFGSSGRRRANRRKSRSRRTSPRPSCCRRRGSRPHAVARLPAVQELRRPVRAREYDLARSLRMDVQTSRHGVAVAALVAGMFAVRATAQESRPSEVGPIDILADDCTVERDIVGLKLPPPPPVVPRDVRVHVLDAQGRPWRTGESRETAVRYADSPLALGPFGYTWGLQIMVERGATSSVDADGLCTLRIASRDDVDAFFLDGDFGGVLRIEQPNEKAFVASALCVHPLRRLRLRGRTALGVPITFSEVRRAETDVGPAIFARPDRPDVIQDGWLVDGSTSSAEARLWLDGVVCPTAPLTVRAEFLGRELTIDVPAECEAFEAPIAGLVEVTFLTASHNRWTLIQPSIESRRTPSEPQSESGWSWHRIAYWLDEAPIKDGCVGRRRALMWPGRYRISPYGERPFDFEVRADEAVEVPLP